MLPATDEDPPVVAIHFRRGETSLRLFTTIATLGTPQDVTLSEIRTRGGMKTSIIFQRAYPQSPHALPQLAVHIAKKGLFTQLMVWKAGQAQRSSNACRPAPCSAPRF